MPKESGRLGESSNRARVSPYPLRSSRTNKHKEAVDESPIESEWEDKRCVICMEPPHNAVLLTCSSSLSGCRPYMCGTGARHSNCFKQFSKHHKKKRSNAAKTLNCPLCRGEVIETTKVTGTAKKFMNAKPRSCPMDDCEFSGAYSQLDKHLKNEHRGLSQPRVDPRRQWRWEEMERQAEQMELMNAAGNGMPPQTPQVVHYQQIPNTHNPPLFHVTFHIPANYAAALLPRLQFRPMNLFSENP